MIVLPELANSFSWLLLLTGYLFSVVFTHVVLFDVHCKLSLWLLLLAEYQCQVVFILSCLFDDVECYLFLLVIIVGSISVSSCVQPCKTSRRHPVVINGTSSNHAKSSLKCRLKLRRIKWVHLLQLLFTRISVCHTQ